MHCKSNAAAQELKVSTSRIGQRLCVCVCVCVKNHYVARQPLQCDSLLLFGGARLLSGQKR